MPLFRFVSENVRNPGDLWQFLLQPVPYGKNGPTHALQIGSRDFTRSDRKKFPNTHQLCQWREGEILNSDFLGNDRPGNGGFESTDNSEIVPAGGVTTAPFGSDAFSGTTRKGTGTMVHKSMNPAKIAALIIPPGPARTGNKK